MKLAVHAKVGNDAKASEGGARAEPASRRQRALRPVESGESESAELHSEPSAATYRLERTPIEAPAAPLRLVVGGRAAFGRDTDAAAHTERPPTPARGLIEGDPANALSERRRSKSEPERERRPRRASERAAAKPDRDEPRARKQREGAEGGKALGARRAAGAKRNAKGVAGAPGAVPAQPVPAPVIAPAPSAASASGAGAALSGTPPQIQRNLNALPPSAQADVYGGLGSALDNSLAVAGTQAASAVPVLSASLEGAAERPTAPTLIAPAAPAVAAPALDSSEPVLQVPEAPEPVPVTAPALPAQYPGMKPGEAAPDPTAVGDVLATLAARPAIVTTLEAPEIPLEAAADPAQLDTLEAGAQSEAGSLLAEAQAGASVSPADVLAPLALQETVVAPPLPELAPLGSAPEVEGMAELASYELSPVDRVAFDAQVGPTLQAAAAGAGGELAANEAAFDEHQASVLAEADAASAAARSEAEAKQQSEVDAARQDLSVEQQSVLDQQQAASDGALADLSSENERSAQEIDDRIETDRATIDSTYARAESDAQAAVDAGAARSENARSEASAETESDSWWDWGIDGWQWFVQEFADKLVSIAEGVTQAVADLFDASIGVATKLVNGAVNFVKQRLADYYDGWRWLITNLVGSVFPALAEKLTACIDAIQANLFALIDTIAAGYLGLLRWVADGIVAGLSAGIAAYQAGVAAYLAVWEAIQQGQWADLGTMLITALLVTVGISPEEFFATFSKIDEIIAAVAEDPTLVIVNAINALSLGFELFGTHFLDHFMAAAVEWLTGAVSIEMPETFDLAGLFDVVCQVLGLTYDHLRDKAVEHVGEGAVTVVEELLAAMWAFVEGGWDGLWTYVKDGLTSLADDVVMTLGSWLVEKAIFVVTRWVAGLAATMGFSAIIEGLIALWQFVMWLKDQFQRFWQIVKATVDSVHEFVMGNIQPAAETIEATLENLIPPAIDLIAKLLGIGNIPDKVVEVVEGVRKVVDDAIDKVFVSLMAAAGFEGKKEAGEEEAEGQGDPVYGSLLPKRAITLEGEEHHLYVNGEPGRFDLVIASPVGPAEMNGAVAADPEAEQATMRANDDLTILNALGSDSHRTTAEDGARARGVKHAEAAVDHVARLLVGQDDSHTPVTLDTLNEPPAPEERSDEEKVRDLEDAQAVLRLAEKQVEDTVQLAEYFERIETRFRLKSIAFERATDGALGVRVSINPDLLGPIAGDLNVAHDPKANPTLPKGMPPEYHTWDAASAFPAYPLPAGEVVGHNMVVTALGPDHGKGQKTKSTEQPGLMARLSTSNPSYYVRGHLLNADLGGLAEEENLFPMTQKANNDLMTQVEDHLHVWVNENKWYVAYEVNVDLQAYGLGATDTKDNWVQSTITAYVGILKADGEYKNAGATVKIESGSAVSPQSGSSTGGDIKSQLQSKITSPADLDEIAKNPDAVPMLVSRKTDSNLAAVEAVMQAKSAEAIASAAKRLLAPGTLLNLDPTIRVALEPMAAVVSGEAAKAGLSADEARIQSEAEANASDVAVQKAAVVAAREAEQRAKDAVAAARKQLLVMTSCLLTQVPALARSATKTVDNEVSQMTSGFESFATEFIGHRTNILDALGLDSAPGVDSLTAKAFSAFNELNTVVDDFGAVGGGTVHRVAMLQDDISRAAKLELGVDEVDVLTSKWNEMVGINAIDRGPLADQLGVFYKSRQRFKEVFLAEAFLKELKTLGADVPDEELWKLGLQGIVRLRNQVMIWP
jgi:hypothetical protein